MMEPIPIYKGDTTDAFDVRTIRIKLKTDVVLTGATAKFTLLSYRKSFTTSEVLTKTFTFTITSEATKAFPLGPISGRLTLYDSSMRVMTAAVNIPFVVRLPGRMTGGSVLVDTGIAEVTVEMGVDYALAYNKPTINGVEVVGDKSLADYGIPSAASVAAETARATAVEAALSASITAETNRAVAAETTLAGRVTTIEGKEAGWDAKQNAISDLAQIRSGAALGSTALQTVPDLDAAKITSGTLASARIPLATGSAKGAVNPTARTTAQTLEVGVDPATGRLYSIGADVGTISYNDLTHKPQIAGTTLSGNKTLNDLGIQAKINDLSTIRSGAAAGATAYQKPSGGIPSTDLTSAVQTSLGKADTALQELPTHASSHHWNSGIDPLLPADIGAEEAGSVYTHDQSSSAHSDLFAGKEAAGTAASLISADVTHAKSISAAGVSAACTPDSTGNVDVSTLFSSANTSLTSTIGSTIAARCQSLDPVNSSISDVIKALKGIN